jgi:transposase
MLDREEAATLAATVAASVPRIEIVGDRRRARSDEFRAAIVAQSLGPDTRIQELARRNGICASLIYQWRRERAVSAASVQLVPGRIAAEVGAGTAALPSPRAEPDVIGRVGSIEIEFAGGERVRVGYDVSLVALRRVISALRG